MDRRTLIQTAGVGMTLRVSTPEPVSTGSGRELALHAISNALRDFEPLRTYSEIQAAEFSHSAFVEIANGRIPLISRINDFADPDLWQVFGALLVTAGGVDLGRIRIFDTPEIANRALIDPIESGSEPLAAAGMPAFVSAINDQEWLSQRLWNVIVDAPYHNESTDVLIALWREIGRVIGAI